MSFKRKGAQNQQKLPSGSRLSTSAPVLLVSTGIPSLDTCLNGGIPVGSVTILKQDEHTSYSRVILSHFMAQGVASNQSLTVVSSFPTPQEIVEHLPSESLLDQKPTQTAENEKPTSDLKIAWRYQSQKRTTANSDISSNIYSSDFLQLLLMLGKNAKQVKDIAVSSTYPSLCRII
jgi:elongator complex protein 4